MLDLDAIEAAEKRSLGGGMAVSGAALECMIAIPALIARIRDQDAEIERLRRFASDMGKTCYSCKVCGHARTTRECLRCEIERLRALCGEAAFHATNHLSLATAISYQPSDAGMAECLPDIRANRDRLRAASKGEQ